MAVISWAFQFYNRLCRSDDDCDNDDFLRRTMIMMITEMIVIVVEVRFAIIQLAVIRGYLHFLLRGLFFTVSLMAIFTLFTCGQIIWFCQALQADTAEVYI